jgi:hypothetical protein
LMWLCAPVFPATREEQIGGLWYRLVWAYSETLKKQKTKNKKAGDMAEEAENLSRKS